jgi:hypothetical protein
MVRVLLLSLLYITFAIIWSIPVVMGECITEEVACGAAKTLQVRTMLVGLLAGFVFTIWISRRSTDHLILGGVLTFLFPIISFILSTLLSSIVFPY